MASYYPRRVVSQAVYALERGGTYAETVERLRAKHADLPASLIGESVERAALLIEAAQAIKEAPIGVLLTDAAPGLFESSEPLTLYVHAKTTLGSGKEGGGIIQIQIDQSMTVGDLTNKISYAAESLVGMSDVLEVLSTHISPYII